MMQWINPQKKMPKLRVPVLCAIQHWHTKGIQYNFLVRVKESDVTWRLADDRAELSYDYNVIYWLSEPIPEIPRHQNDY